MDKDAIAELESAANIIMASPNQITSEQRHVAEAVFINFRKSKSPYALCRQILENAQGDYVKFEAAEALKIALIREWNFLQKSDILSLRQYLLHYISSRNAPPYVQERILQTIAIMVKRGSVDDFGEERCGILNEVEKLIINADSTKQILGCKLITNLIQEYANTFKSTDVGLPWEVHFKVKKQFEATDMRRIFQFCAQVLSELVKNDPPLSQNIITLMDHLLTITETILTWGYVSPMLPKKLVGFYETVYVADQAPALRLSASWKPIIFAPQLLPLIFQIYWKIREYDDLSHHALTCLVQLASLNGGIMSKESDKTQYLNFYMENFLKLISSVTVKNKESLGISQIVKNIQFFFSNEVLKLPRGLQESYIDEITRLTCSFMEGALVEEESSEDKYFVDAFENLLESWAMIVQEYQMENINTLEQSAIQIFNVYLKSHLNPPDGTRKFLLDNVEDIEDDEDNDRVKYVDQLQTIGLIGRVVPSHSFSVIYKLLEDRSDKLRSYLHSMQTQAMSINDATTLEKVFEDLHWTILIAGHILCMSCEGETPLIPSEVIQFSIDECNKSNSNLEATLKALASVQQVGTDVDCLDKCDEPIRIFISILKLCSIETSAAEVKLGHFMSPELGCTLMWFMKRWCLSYLLPIENYYQEISPILIGALGKDTVGANFVVNFLLSKIQSNICFFNSEPILLKDTVELFADVVAVKDKSIHIVKTEGLWNLVNLQSKLQPGVLPPNIRRGLFKGFTLAGSCLCEETDLYQYFVQILKPVQQRFKQILCQDNFNRIYQEESIKNEIIDILECFIGVAKGAVAITFKILFEFLSPILSELPVVLNLYHNYQVIVHLILDLFGQTARNMLCYLSGPDSRKLYESTYAVVQAYAKCNENRFSSEVFNEESNYQDISLVMDLLSFVISKDCFNLSPLNINEDNLISASDVGTYGLSFIMPLMTIDLLKYPSLCLQYYRLIVLLSDMYPERICSLPDDLLTKLLRSIEIGLTQFSSEIVQICLDFIEGIATHIYRNLLENTKIYQAFMPFLKLIMDLTLSHQINSDLLSTASTCLFALISCYSDQYQILVQNLIQSQTDPAVAERLASEFTKLTARIELRCARQKFKFRELFDKFIANVHGFLLVK